MSVEHCHCVKCMEALGQARAEVLVAVKVNIKNSLKVWAEESDHTFESLVGIIAYNLELVQPAAAALEKLLEEARRDAELRGLKLEHNPEWCWKDCPVACRIAELEKARAIEGKK